MRNRRALVALTAGTLLVLGAVGPAAGADPRHLHPEGSERIAPTARPGIQSFPGANGRIAYSADAAGYWPAQIWAQDLDGANLAQLTFGTVGQGANSPAWSPGGTLIAFTRDQTSSTTDESDDIYLMNADGSGLRPLTSTSSGEYAPNFSPNGARIAFSSNRAGGNFEIYTMKIDGSDVQRLTTNAADDYHPNWSPDGTRIAFSSNRAGNFEIYTMNVNGSGVTRLTTRANDDYSPNWSPDGTRIAFTETLSGFDDVLVMNANGSNVVDLTNAPGTHEWQPSWSPDGTWIIYAGNQSGDADVLASTAGGTFLGGIAYTYDNEWNPDWQPIPAFPLVDAQFSPFKADIEWLFASGITSGCTAERFCPDDTVTREQMAAFLDRALTLPTTTTDYFTDDESSMFEASINRLAAAGITTGCTATTFCPKATVKRDQMASFLARAFALPGTTTDFFTDDEGNVHEVNINRLAASAITSGCTATTYCPAGVVTRGQMAAFLHRALT